MGTHEKLPSPQLVRPEGFLLRPVAAHLNLHSSFASRISATAPATEVREEEGEEVAVEDGKIKVRSAHQETCEVHGPQD